MDWYGVGIDVREYREKVCAPIRSLCNLVHVFCEFVMSQHVYGLRHVWPRLLLCQRAQEESYVIGKSVGKSLCIPGHAFREFAQASRPSMYVDVTHSDLACCCVSSARRIDWR